MNWSFPNASEFDVQGSALRSRLSELFHSIKLNPCGGFEAEMAQTKTPMNKKNMDKS
nr:AntM [Pseudonocardia antarctica]